MTIATLISDVISDTGRPDKSVLIGRYVRAAIIKCHEIDFFPQDLVTATVTPGSPGTSITEDLPARFRKFFAVYPVSSGGVPLGKRFTLDEAGFADSYSPVNRVNFSDYYKVVGNSIQIESVDTVDKFVWLYYEYPNLTEDTAETWITLRYPQAVVDLATGYIQNKLGNTEIGNFSLQAFSSVWVPQIQQNLIVEL
jgi:hypothetical protein